MAGKQLLISKLSINPFWDIYRSTCSVIDKVNRLLSLLSSSGVTVFGLCSFQIHFKGHEGAIMEFPDWAKIK